MLNNKQAQTDGGFQSMQPFGMQGPQRTTGMDPYQQQDFGADNRQATLSSAPSKNEQFTIQPVYLPPQSKTKFNSSQPYQQNVTG